MLDRVISRRRLRSSDQSRDDAKPIGSEIAEILGPPPLYAGETDEDYQSFYQGLRSSVLPRDAVEELWVRDIADLSWECLRLRRLKAKFMVSAKADALSDLLDRLVNDFDEDFRDDGEDASDPESDAQQSREYKPTYQDQVKWFRNELFEGWLRGDADCTERIDQYLDQAGYDWQVVEAEALSNKFDDFERFDRMIAQADARRNAVLHEIERHRTAFARGIRNAVDAEFEDITGKEAAE